MWPFKAEIGVSKLRDELAENSRQLRTLKLDLDDLWDRFNRLSGKLAKRAAREDTLDQAGNNGGEQVESASALSPTFSRLSPQQRRIQMEILSRRRAPNGGS